MSGTTEVLIVFLLAVHHFWGLSGLVLSPLLNILLQIVDVGVLILLALLGLKHGQGAPGELSDPSKHPPVPGPPHHRPDPNDPGSSIDQATAALFILAAVLAGLYKWMRIYSLLRIAVMGMNVQKDEMRETKVFAYWVLWTCIFAFIFSQSDWDASKLGVHEISGTVWTAIVLLQIAMFVPLLPLLRIPISVLTWLGDFFQSVDLTSVAAIFQGFETVLKAIFFEYLRVSERILAVIMVSSLAIPVCMATNPEERQYGSPETFLMALFALEVHVASYTFLEELDHIVLDAIN